MKPGTAAPVKPGMLLRALAVLPLSAVLTAAMAAGEDRLEDWHEADTTQVSEGELRFIEPRPDSPVLHADTRLRLTPASLQSGWVELRQCYRHLDAVDKTEIVYAYREMEDLEVTRVQNIQRHRVEPRAIRIEGVGQGAQLCLQARVRILRRLSATAFGLRQGPYHRRFLDGYYPYHLSLAVSYPRDAIRLARIEPAPQPGFELVETADGIAIESWFEGEMRVDMEFATY